MGLDLINPEIKSCMFLRLSQPGTPPLKILNALIALCEFTLGPWGPSAHWIGIADLRTLNVLTHLIFMTTLGFSVSITLLLYSPLRKWRRHGGTERLRNMPKVTQLVESESEPTYFGSKVLTLHKHTGRGSGKIVSTSQDLCGLMRPSRPQCIFWWKGMITVILRIEWKQQMQRSELSTIT